MTDRQVINCVGIVCFRGSDVLLIKRGKPPRLGEWSIPGGRIEPGENEKTAALRELMEETSIRAKLGPKIETVPVDFDERSLLLHDYAAAWISGEPVAGDDAAHAEFVDPARLATILLWSETRRIIEKARNLI